MSAESVNGKNQKGALGYRLKRNLVGKQLGEQVRYKYEWQDHHVYLIDQHLKESSLVVKLSRGHETYRFCT